MVGLYTYRQYSPLWYDSVELINIFQFQLNLFVDDLPIWGIVGELDEKDNAYYIWTHKKFEIGYNENMVSDQ